MKKIKYLILGLIVVLLNISTLFTSIDKQTNDIIFNKHKMFFRHKSDPSIDIEEFKKDMIQFSKDNDINISQYSFLNEDELNIYSTNVQKDSSINLEKGEFQQNTSYISNETLNINNKNQSGTFYFPPSKLKIHIYDFSEVRNVGLGNQFYFNKIDKNKTDIFINKFSKYGDAYFEEYENIHFLKFANKILITIIVISFIIFSIITFYYFIEDRKKFLLQKLWGYSNLKIITLLLKKIVYFLIINISLILILYLAFIIIFNQQYFVKDFIKNFIVTNITLLILVLAAIPILYFFTQIFTSDINKVKGKSVFKKIQVSSVVLKGLVSITVIYMAVSSLTTFSKFKAKVDDLDYWKQTQNIFKVNLGYTPRDYFDKAQDDRLFNDRALRLYKELENQHAGFLINSENFHYIDDGSTPTKYFYHMNVQGDEELYSPQGRSIIINHNYLKVNPIDTNALDTLVIDKIKDDDNILNILVPEQLKDFESDIINSYKKWFHFRKVEVSNLYNKDLGYPLSEISINELDINIIYTKKNQTYFTFNPLTGDKNNMIEDPIAIIYNESVDTSSIGAYITTSVYFIDDSMNGAYNSIKPLIDKIGINEIDSVTSVFNEVGNEISQLRTILFQQAFSLIIVVIFSTLLLFSTIWTYFNLNIYQINIKYLFGFSYWEKNKFIILPIIITHIVGGLVVTFKYKTSLILIISICTILSMIELIFINKLTNHLSRKNINKLLKGDFYD